MKKHILIIKYIVIGAGIELRKENQMHHAKLVGGASKGKKWKPKKKKK